MSAPLRGIPTAGGTPTVGPISAANRPIEDAVRLLLLLLAVGVVFFVVSHGEFHFSTSSSAEPFGVLDARPSAAVVEVQTVAIASTSTQADEAVIEIRELLQRASYLSLAKGAALIRRRLPALVSVVEKDVPVAQSRIAALPVRTPTGSSCRHVVLELFTRERHNIRVFASEVFAHHGTWPAVDRFMSPENAKARWYVRQVARCTKHAAPADRPALEDALGSI
jgi:hypothetical protein